MASLRSATRSATSIGANITEGGDASSKKEFINYFQISLKSASETIYWLELLREINYSEKEVIATLIKECMEIRGILLAILIKSKNNE